VVHRDVAYAFEIDTGRLSAHQAHAALRRDLGL
jgi:chloramphenicol 3-O-phosphotransferase